MVFFFSSRRRHTRCSRDWSSDVCSSDLPATYATNVRGVFACGDFVTGPTTLIEAAGHGKKCAYAIDRYLAARTDVTVAANVKITSSWRHDMPEFYDVLPRQHIPMTPVEMRMPSADPQINLTTQVEQ